MDRRFKRRWVAALRSGDYRQGRGRLRCDDRFCCLGVACDIDDAAGWLRAEDAEGVAYAYGTHWQTAILPDEFRRRLGLTPQEMMALANMNDLGSSFGDIADRIESDF